MDTILHDLRYTLGVSLLLVLIFVLIFFQGHEFDLARFLPFLVTLVHVASSVMWVGLIWYLNLVQIPLLKQGTAPALSSALLSWSFMRWSAVVVLVSGFALSGLNGYMVETLTIGMSDGFVTPKYIALGLAMWLAFIMFINVWFVIWPNQKIVLGLLDAPEDVRLVAAETSILFARINLMLSLPVLFGMVAARSLY